MGRFFKQSLLVAAACLLAGAAATVHAQTQAACGCTFVANQQPREVRVLYAGTNTPVAAVPGTVVHLGDVINVTP